jgi:hypothetical protein
MGLLVSLNQLNKPPWTQFISACLSPLSPVPLSLAGIEAPSCTCTIRQARVKKYLENRFSSSPSPFPPCTSLSHRHWSIGPQKSGSGVPLWLGYLATPRCSSGENRRNGRKRSTFADQIFEVLILLYLCISSHFIHSFHHFSSNHFIPAAFRKLNSTSTKPIFFF